jgi:hypothetical protein
MKIHPKAIMFRTEAIYLTFSLIKNSSSEVFRTRCLGHFLGLETNAYFPKISLLKTVAQTELQDLASSLIFAMMVLAVVAW